MRLRVLLVVAALSTLPCCASAPGKPEVVRAGESGAKTAPAAETTALRLVYAGTWRSAACGLRNHDQVLDLALDGSFRLEDRISPCPQESACIWSGVEKMDGRWQIDGDAIDLQPAKDVPAIARPPTRLQWEPPPAGAETPAGALEDQRGCLFVREKPKPAAEPAAPPAPQPASGQPAQGPAAAPSAPAPSGPPAPSSTTPPEVTPSASPPGPSAPATQPDIPKQPPTP